MRDIVEIPVRTSGCYIGVFDLSSAIHREESLDSVFERGKSDAEKAGEAAMALWYINERLLDRTRNGDILVWIVLFDGCFKVRIRILSSEEQFVPKVMHTSQFLSGEIHPLNCASGKVVVASLHELGNRNLSATIDVEPGRYEVGLVVDDEQEAKHTLWDENVDYPINDGPDWSLTLKKISVAGHMSHATDREIDPDN